MVCSMASSTPWRACGITPSRQPALAADGLVAFSSSIAVWNCGCLATQALSVGSSSALPLIGK